LEEILTIWRWLESITLPITGLILTQVITPEFLSVAEKSNEENILTLAKSRMDLFSFVCSIIHLANSGVLKFQSENSKRLHWSIPVRKEVVVNFILEAVCGGKGLGQPSGALPY
jgi:hypothetical protein